MHAAYYNEFDPLKAEILREAIKASVVAPGDVDERSITDVTPADLLGYTQCHFFAGGGFWSLALRQAGWPDDRPCWTGSCPCPSFSAAGKGLGFRDPRHLWPAWFRLIRECQPPVVFGEQVANAINHGWLDLVSTNLEGEGYAIGSIVLGAHSVGAPHIRQRLYFVAVAQEERSGAGLRDSRTSRLGWNLDSDGSCPDLLGDAEGRGCGISQDEAQPGHSGHADSTEQPLGLADADGADPGDGELQRSGELGLQPQDGGAGSVADAELNDGRTDKPGRRQDRRTADGWDSETLRPSPLNGFWRDADWIGCRDGKWRPVEPGTFPLVDGRSNHLVPFCDIGTLDAEIEKGTAEARVGRLRLYGDAICVPAAQAFIEAYLETTCYADLMS